MKIKGMHDVPTVQSLINHSAPATRAQMVAQLARMEHERVRLQRELSMWLSKQQQTQWRLGKVQQHIAVLQRALDETPRSVEPPEAGDGLSRRRTTRREIHIEY